MANFAGEELYLSQKEKRDFINSFFVYYKSGTPLIDAMKKISDKSTAPRVKNIAKNIYNELVKGKPFDKVMLKYENVLGRVIAGLLISGEQSGKLIKVLARIQGLLQKENQVKQKIISALTYPAMLLLMVTGVICIFAFFVFPMLEGGGKVNVLTQAIVFAIKTAVVYGVIFGLLIFAHKIHFVDKQLIPILSNLPKVGDIIKSSNYANFFLVMLVAYEGGLSAASMLDLASETLKQQDAKKKMRKALKYIMEGNDISNSLTKANALPEEYIATIATGETTGELDKSLTEIITEIDENTDSAISALSKLFEPVMMIIMGIVVCVLLVKIYGKLYNGSLF